MPPPVAVTQVPPNWFASVMGTGILAVAATTLPVQAPGQRYLALGAWLLAAVLLLAVVAATLGQWARHPLLARAHLADPVTAHFYGAPPMALLTVGAGTLLVGPELIGHTAAVAVDWALWTSGTLLGLVVAVLVPYIAFTRHRNGPAAAFGGWLMPIVPPMVSATTGVLLVPTLSSAGARQALLALCLAMFGFSLLAAAIVITLIWNRLAHHGVGAAAAVPTLWIVLGPLGQSVTAANGMAARVEGRFGSAAIALAVVFGIAVWGFALLWLALALGLTIRTVRLGLPFTLAWWSFTFPLGTVVTGTSALAFHTGLDVFAWTAALLFAGLLAAWTTVAARTLSWLRSGASPATPPAAVRSLPVTPSAPRTERFDYAI